MLLIIISKKAGKGKQNNKAPPPMPEIMAACASALRKSKAGLIIRRGNVYIIIIIRCPMPSKKFPQGPNPARGHPGRAWGCYKEWPGRLSFIMCPGPLKSSYG